ncbi:glycosyltransferase [Alicyclobacillus kakegawensis]|uniref:glycosyltransferase n=1 Tax=Alicyclobacillus kakegawensis TaxID=392012 RepID=UPI0008309208|nr:glycosyltransferase [Alicyclobacillus kakegawensis]
MSQTKTYRVFMLMHGVRVETGGMTRVMLNRSKMLSEMGHHVDLVTLDEGDYIGIRQRLRELGRLGPRVGIINLYEDYRTRMSRPGWRLTRWRYRRAKRLAERGFRVRREETGQGVTAHYYRDGRMVKSKQWNKSGRLTTMVYYDAKERPVLRLLYNRQGFAAVRQHLHPELGQPSKVEYCTADGFVFLTRWYMPENGQMAAITLYDRFTGEERLFRDEFSFHVAWLNDLCRRQATRPFLICDGIGSAPKVLAMDGDACYRIYPTHSTHLNAPYTFGSPVKKSYQPILDHLHELDALVVPTRSQYDDVVRQYGQRDNVFVIPHSVTPMQDMLLERDTKTVVMVSRLNPEKAIEEAIQVFARVIQAVPEARLEIYGEGPCRADLQKWIDDLGLRDKVRLMHYVTQVEKVFRKASVMLLTSKFEGFSLVILESMWNKTPVVSYDINYGPRDIIRDGETGYLVPPGDREQLAQRLSELLLHPERAQAMGERARMEIQTRYAEQVIGPLWERLFAALERSRTFETSPAWEPVVAPLRQKET